ncbi:hypothetical protein YC2023_117672 [Brassica napus]
MQEFSNKYLDMQVKKHPTHAYLRYDSVGNFEDLQLIFGNGVATSGSAVGMDDTTDARTFRVEEKTQVRENIIFIEAIFICSQVHSMPRYIVTVEMSATRREGRSDVHPRLPFLGSRFLSSLLNIPPKGSRAFD